MNQIKRIVSVLAAAAMALALGGCTTYDNFRAAFIDKEPKEPAVDQTVVKLGVFEPLTGDDAETAADEIKGIELAHALYPFVEGIPIELVYADNKSSVDGAVEAAQTLIDSGVSAVLGSCNSVLTLAASDMFEEAEIPAVAATCKNPLVTQTNDYYFRVCIVEAYQGKSAADYIYDVIGKEALMVCQAADDDYGSTMTDQLKAEMERLTRDPDCVKVLEYDSADENIQGIVERLASNRRKTVFFPGSAEAADKFIKTAKEAGYSFDWIGSSLLAGMEQIDPEADHSYLNGVSYIADYDPGAELSSMTDVFRDAWKAEYGEDATPSDAAALGFDAYLVAVEGLKNAGVHARGWELRKGIRFVSALPAATGVITMGVDGDPIKDVIVMKYSDGSASPVYTVSPDRGESEEE